MLALLILAACTGERTVECATAPDPEAPQAPRVLWQTPSEGSSWVEYAWGGEEFTTEPIADGTSHDVPLVGIPPLTDVAFTAFTRTDRTTFRCESSTRTANLPANAPDLSVTVNDPAASSSEAFLIGSAMTLTQSTQFAIDRDGRIRWLVVDDADHYSLMSKPSLHGGLVKNRFNREPWFKEGELVWEPLVGPPTRHETASVAGSHHVFLELPDGNVVFMRTDVREAELSDGPTSIVGDEIVELSPDGTVRSLFTTWDHLEIRDSITDHLQTWSEGLDWTHGNALAYVEERDAVMFSMANVQTIVEIDRATGAVNRSYSGVDDWTLDGSGDDYVVTSGEHFHHQHDAKLSAQGTLLVSATETVTRHSIALEYAIDESTHTLREIWRYKPSPPVNNWALGQVQELANGNRLVATNYAGLVQEVTPEGTVVWEAHTPINTVFGQVYLVDELPR